MVIESISRFAAALLTVGIISTPSYAVPVFTTGAGSAVSSTDLSANFDSLTNGAFAYYQEGGLSFSPMSGSVITCQGGSLCGNHIGFQGMSGGIYYHIEIGAKITAVDNGMLSAFEVMVGTGFAESVLHGVWETYASGSMTASGVFDVAVGTIVGIADTAGFDEIRIGTYGSNCTNTAFGGCGSATALDFASAQRIASSIPEPGMLALMVLGLAGLGFSRRQTR